MDRKFKREEIPEVAEQLGHAHAPRYVDPNFLQELRRLDTFLEPRWNVWKKRWEIYRDNLYVMVVQTVGGDYAPLDNRVFQKLFLADTSRYRDKFDFIRHMHMEDEHLMNMKRHEQDEFMRACARDMAPIFRGRHSVNANSQKIAVQEKLSG